MTVHHAGPVMRPDRPEWARRHGQPFTLTLTGTAGGQWRSGEAGEHLQLDALDFCWIVAARQPGTGLMATKVPF